MEFVYKMVIYIMIVGLSLVAVILDHADTKNQMYLEMSVTEAILKSAPYGYITTEIQDEIEAYLVTSRGFDPDDIILEGTILPAQRKIKGTGDERIELKITYPRTILLFFGDLIDKPIVAYRYINTEYPAS